MSQTNFNYQPVRSNPVAFLSALLLLGLMLSAGAVAAEPAGRLLFARGDVKILHTGEAPRPAGRGDRVEVGDSIQTGANSNAQLRLTDGAMIALRAHTLFQIEKQQYNKDAPGEGSQAAQLLRGGMRAITGAIGHENPSAVTYRTPVATIGIRGTVIDVIYVPEGGIPGLPGVKPGTYTLVLKGQVEVSNPAGSVTLAAGEIAYTADAGTPPVLRPDLTWIFVQYSSLTKSTDGEDETGDEGDGDTGTEGGDSGDSGGTTIGTAPDTGSVDNVLTETAVPQATVKPGPYAMAIAADLAVYEGTFVDSVVSIGSSGELLYATGGTNGLIYTFDALASPTTTGSATAGDSTINWGQYSGSTDVVLYDSSGGTLTATLGVEYIDATQVMTTLNDLPTTGIFTYTYAGGAGTTLDAASNLVVDFGSATMDVNLSVGADSYTAANKNIADFYGSGVALDNATYGPGSTIKGRFVGSDANGAMTMFDLTFDGYRVGTAAFTR